MLSLSWRPAHSNIKIFVIIITELSLTHIQQAYARRNFYVSSSSFSEAAWFWWIAFHQALRCAFDTQTSPLNMSNSDEIRVWPTISIIFYVFLSEEISSVSAMCIFMVRWTCRKGNPKFIFFLAGQQQQVNRGNAQQVNERLK